MSKSSQISKEPQPAQELEIDNLETVRVLSDPMRLEIIQQLMEPRTVKELSANLDIAPTRLYYHMNLLEQHGIVRVSSTRIVSGIIEKRYCLTAYSFRPKPGLVSALGAESVTLHETLLEQARMDLRRAFNADLIGSDGTDGPPDPARKATIGRMITTLTPEQAQLLHERLEQLVKDIKGTMEPTPTQDASADVYSLTFVFHRTVDPRSHKRPTKDSPKSAKARARGKS
jgi:DNA-binding transcriptional ArsR family regulator